MRESAIPLSALRERIALEEQGRCTAMRLPVASGHAGLDGFMEGGLGRGALHEIFAKKRNDAGSAAIFATVWAIRTVIQQPEDAQALLWLRSAEAERQSGRIYAPGFVEYGGDPETLLLACARNDIALLRAAADAVRCTGLGAVIIECRGNIPLLDLTASRKLALAVRDSGVTAFLLRIDAQPGPSAAHTRWAVRPAPSVPLAANAPGPPVFEAELLRQRAGPAGKIWQMEWDRDRRQFREAGQEKALSGIVVPVPADGQMADRASERARLTG